MDQVAFSLDGATAVSHDTFRRVPGAWNWHEFDALAELVSGFGVAFWEVFFLIPVGRGAKLAGLTPEQFEEVFAKLGPMVREKPYIIKLTEGQHFRRFGVPARASGVCAGLQLPPRAVNAGDGFLFIDHRGEICPSGFLSVSRGNVRADGLAATYRYDSLFTGLRDHSRLQGKCGVCEYREICGGSRSRAWATTGDVWAEDPACAYRPVRSSSQ